MFRINSKEDTSTNTNTFKKIDVSDLYPKRKTISEKIKEELELAKLTRLLK